MNNDAHDGADGAGWNHWFLQNQHPVRPLTLVTNTDREAIEALAHVAELLPGVACDTYRWKWVLIAAHNAVQAYMVLALAGSSGVRPLKSYQAERLLAARAKEMADTQEPGRHHSGSPPGADGHTNQEDPSPKRKTKPPPDLDEYLLNGFLNLYASIQDADQMSDFFDSKPFVPRGSQSASIEHLNKIRNKFIHFVPERFNDHIGDYPILIEDALEVIRFLTYESNMIPWRHNLTYYAKTQELLAVISVDVAAIKQRYQMDSE